MKILIEALIKPRVVVLNVYASTYDVYYHFHSRNTMTQGMVLFGPSANFVSMQMPRASIHACKRSRHHVVEFEGDFMIFDSIIAPLCNDTNTPSPQQQHPHMELNSYHLMKTTCLLERSHTRKFAIILVVAFFF